MKGKTLLLLPFLATHSQGATIIASADTFIQRGSGTDSVATAVHGADAGVILKNAPGNSTERKGYLLFDLTSITGIISTATINLTYSTNSGTSTKVINFATPNVQSVTFPEATTNWVNAPNNAADNGLTDVTTLLTGQNVASSVAVDTAVKYGNQALVDYLNAEIATGNKEAMVIVRRTDGFNGDNLIFYSKEYLDGSMLSVPAFSPTLEYTLVPEPSALLLGALGLLPLLRRKR